jgi:hypothetical protein
MDLGRLTETRAHNEKRRKRAPNVTGRDRARLVRLLKSEPFAAVIAQTKLSPSTVCKIALVAHDAGEL